MNTTKLVRLALPLLLLSTAGLLLAQPGSAAAPGAPSRPPRETLQYGDNEVVMDRTTKATEEDLKLPFYAGAQVGPSYTYRVSTKAGKLLSYYAMATLTTKDRPEVVAKRYAAQLPGRPKPETLKDKQGTRIVLAVTSGTEVRSVTITRSKTGSEIRLTRATKHGEELTLPKAEAMPAPRMGPGGRGRMGPRGRGRMGPGRRGPSRRGGAQV